VKGRDYDAHVYGVHRGAPATIVGSGGLEVQWLRPMESAKGPRGLGTIYTES